MPPRPATPWKPSPMARPAPPSSKWSISASTGLTDRLPAQHPAPLDLLPDGLAPLAEPAQLVEEDHQRHTMPHPVRDARLARSPASHRAVVHLELLYLKSTRLTSSH